MSSPTVFEEGRPPVTRQVGTSNGLSLLECESGQLPDVRGPHYVAWLRSMIDQIVERTDQLKDDPGFRRDFFTVAGRHRRRDPGYVLRKYGYIEALPAPITELERSQNLSNGLR